MTNKTYRVRVARPDGNVEITEYADRDAAVRAFRDATNYQEVEMIVRDWDEMTDMIEYMKEA